MDRNQLNDALDKLFLDEGERIVFWNDPEGEFEYQIPFLKIEGVEIVDLRRRGGLETKILVDRERPKDRFLLYSPTEEPDYDDDWLLDIRLYSRAFRADRASIILDDLGLKNQYLREHLNKRRKFFDNKERTQKFKSLVSPEDKENDLDLKMLAVLTKADQTEFSHIILALFQAIASEDETDIHTSPESWKQVEKFELDGAFWQKIKDAFGYQDETPTLGKFLTRLFATDLIAAMKSDPLPALMNLQLPPARQSNVVVLMAQWRDSSSRSVSYDILAEIVADELHIVDRLNSKGIEDLLDVWTFLDIEKSISSLLKTQVISTDETIDLDEVERIVSRRKNGHWVSANVPDSQKVPRKAFRAIYEALALAAEFYDMKNQFPRGFEYDDAGEMYADYEKRLFRFDQIYRLFIEQADIAQSQSWDNLKALRDKVEGTYIHWYLLQLSLTWGKFVEKGLLTNWRIQEVPRQQSFYSDHVKQRLKEAEKRKVFVIISDAFRYEAAEELNRLLTSYRYDPDLKSQLGVLPSYTRLGMASLLPYKILDYTDKGDVLVDGLTSSGLEARNEILKRVGGMAIRADELLGKRKEEGRQLVAEKKVVYIYHDKIDAMGDDRNSEGSTFEAVRKAIEEVANTVRFVINSLNGNYVVVTADHGFLFTETQPGETDKSRLSDKPDGTIIAKKRYLIGHDLGESEEAWHGDTSKTAGTNESMEFWIPKGPNRFHFIGGSRFIHGGAMLQEIVVPVLTVRQVKGKGIQETKTTKVKVHVLGSNHKITTARHRFELLQMEAVTDRVKPITLKVAVYEGNDPVTNIETLTFDSDSQNLDERKKSVTLVLRDREYSRMTQYRLILRDTDTDVEHQGVDIIIDRAFTDDF